MSETTPRTPGPGNGAGRPATVVDIVDITKRFGATQALAGVTFDVRPGETVGLLGANGAGKSTLIKILAGLHAPTSGVIKVGGHERQLGSPVQARAHGIITVHQNIDDGVVFGLTVAENLMLDRLGGPSRNPFVTQKAIRRGAQAMLDQLNLDLPLGYVVEELTASQRQQVSIARALIKKPELLILDEPTSTLSAREAEQLFTAVREMQHRGVAILYVSHHMSEIQDLCDRAIVLRNGRVVSDHAKPLDRKAITASILGELQLSSSHSTRVGTSVVLDARDIRVRPDGKPIDVTFRRGEVVGITGLVGAGKTELLEQIFGTRPLVSGELALNGQPFLPKDPAAAIQRGVVMMPEERAAQAIFPRDSIADHCSIGRLSRSSRYGFMNAALERRFATEVIDSVNVQTTGPSALIESLSGGNQQKVLVGRWLSEKHELLLLDEPFRGVDIGARGVISAALREYSLHSAVVVASSDPEEVIEVADRVLVMVEGRIVTDISADDLDAERLAEIMSATTHSGENT